MATFHIVNFGCRATQADAAAIERQLLGRGLAPAGADAAACVVVHTCTVTSDADAAARQAIRRIHRANPAARIVVTGCYAQRAPEELAALGGVTWVAGNAHAAQIPDLFVAPQDFVAAARLAGGAALVPESGPPTILTGDAPAAGEAMTSRAGAFLHDRTRPVLKIQDGCHHRCAYCILPSVRGPSRSLPPQNVVEEVRRLAEAGAREVVLSGINLGGYGRDLAPRVTLADVVRRILDETPLEQLRLSSLEPMDVTADFVALLAAAPRIAPHLHIPLQSGSDAVLARMRRWYRAAHYARRVELVRERLPQAAIGADVIAGFPGETEEDHAATLALLRALPFTYLHVFAFSPRPGTAAAQMTGQVPAAVIRRRARELRAVAAEKSAAFRAAHLGRALRVLTLRGRPDPASGAPGRWTPAITGNYLQVRVAGAHPPNTWLEVRATSTSGEALLATVHP